MIVIYMAHCVAAYEGEAATVILASLTRQRNCNDSIWIVPGTMDDQA